MSLSVQLRRGTSTQNSTFTGRPGELIYTTDNKKLFVHDGTTAGGTEIGAIGSLPDDSVTFAKIEEIASQTILGNNTGSSSDILELTPAQVRAIINVANGATANDSDANLKNRANHTGTQTASTISDFDTEVANNSAVSANTAKVTNATHTGEVTGATNLTIANGVVDSDNLSTTLDFGSIA
jgi:hypothetical protein